MSLLAIIFIANDDSFARKKFVFIYMSERLSGLRMTWLDLG